MNKPETQHYRIRLAVEVDTYATSIQIATQEAHHLLGKLINLADPARAVLHSVRWIRPAQKR